MSIIELSPKVAIPPLLGALIALLMALNVLLDGPIGPLLKSHADAVAEKNRAEAREANARTAALNAQSAAPGLARFAAPIVLAAPETALDIGSSESAAPHEADFSIASASATHSTDLVPAPGEADATVGMVSDALTAALLNRVNSPKGTALGIAETDANSELNFSSPLTDGLRNRVNVPTGVTEPVSESNGGVVWLPSQPSQSVR